MFCLQSRFVTMKYPALAIRGAMDGRKRPMVLEFLIFGRAFSPILISRAANVHLLSRVRSFAEER